MPPDSVRRVCNVVRRVCNMRLRRVRNVVRRVCNMRLRRVRCLCKVHLRRMRRDAAGWDERAFEGVRILS